jgi:hypothetical protein
MRIFIFILITIILGLNLYSEDAFQEFKIKRKNVFEFIKKPEIKEEKNSTTISFAVKDFCDVTIAIENSEGKIIRHLVSGVLGPKAPEPLKKDSLEQSVVWDNKDDQGAYVENSASPVVRVSLGLQAEYEKDLDYSPYSIISRLPNIAATPEGVYVYDTNFVDFLKFFKHDGTYQKTIYPFPPSQIKNVKGLKWGKAFDGHEILIKESNWHQTLLTSGDNDTGSAGKGHGIQYGSTVLAVNGKRIALAYEDLNRISTDGNSGGLPLKGSKLIDVSISHYVGEGGDRHHGGATGMGAGKKRVGPSSMAFSPDGKFVYLTGYMWENGGIGSSVQAVFKMSYDTNEEIKVFAGVNSQTEYGSDNSHFSVPTSVDTDTKGNVYVSDYMNDRVQIFDASGTFQKSLSVKKPAKLLVHQKTGEIYIFTWGIVGVPADLTKKLAYYRDKIPQKLTIFSSYPEMKLKEEYDFPLGPSDISQAVVSIGPFFQIALDSWTEYPTLWVVGAGGKAPDNMDKGLYGPDPKVWESGIRLIQLKAGKWEVIGNFQQKAKKDQYSFWNGNNKKLIFNPKNEKLYVADGGHSLLEIDPVSTKKRFLNIPFSTDDTDIDINGLLYLRTHTTLTRWEMEPWREVPFDYGQDMTSSASHASPKSVSGIAVPGSGTVCGYESGISVNSNGDIAIHCHTPDTEGKKFDQKSALIFTPAEFEGRNTSSYSGVIYIWDKYGKLIGKDVIGGADKNDGISIDKDRNIYLMTIGNRLIEGKPFDDGGSSTLVKFKKDAKGKFISSDGSKIPLSPANYPKRPPDLRTGQGSIKQWVENNEWLYGGVSFAGFSPTGNCACWYTRWRLDYFSRSIIPVPMSYEVHVLDTSGNLILKIGQYGNEDSKGKNSIEPIGGDEVGLFHPCFVATQTDRRIFISDFGNGKILSVKLKYVVNEMIPVKIIK